MGRIFHPLNDLISACDDPCFGYGRNYEGENHIMKSVQEMSCYLPPKDITKNLLPDCEVR